MALRAGYYGIKKNVLDVISKLSGAKVIKTIGDGLKLTTAGKLSCDIDAETMEFKNGKLAAKSTGFDFSTVEFNTGKKWIDGGDIYGIVLNNATITVPGGSNFGTIDLTNLNIDKPLYCYATNTENGFIYPLVSDSSSNQYGVRFTKNDFGLRKPSAGGSITITTMQVTLFYTKSASE